MFVWVLPQVLVPTSVLKQNTQKNATLFGLTYSTPKVFSFVFKNKEGKT